MSTTNTAPTGATGDLGTVLSSADDPAFLRLVLFGMPDAGKSSLLGALAQAALTQERALSGKIINPAPELGELQRRVYDDQPRETTAEIVPYRLTYESTADPGGQSPVRTPAVIYDCDGRVANELLNRRRLLSNKSGDLARTVLSADALVLIVDASASPEQMDADFAEFVRFLRLLRAHRGDQGDVGGLPVFLILSKCDLLARSGDSMADWQGRITARKAEVAERFSEFLSHIQSADREDGPEPFGSLELHVAAASVRRPPLAASPAQPREPFGVAETFRDTLTAAKRYRQRRKSAGRRLWWTIAGAVALLAVMITTAAVLLSTREPSTPNPLAGRIENYRAREGLSAASRLRGPLVARRGELTEFSRDAGFKGLPPDQQEFVNRRLKELEEYIALQDRLSRERPPADALTPDDLSGLEKRLKDDVRIPKDYQDEWALTEAVQVRQKWLADIPALQQAVSQAELWYDGLKRRGDRLADRLAQTPAPGTDQPPLLNKEWSEAVTKLFKDADEPPFRETDVIPGVGSAPGQPLVTYAAALKFARVRDRKEEWEQVKQRLFRLQELAVTLGLTGETEPTKAALRIPVDFRVSESGVRAESFRKLPQVGELAIVSQPDSVQPELREAAHRSYRHLMEAGRAEVMRRLREISPDDRETASRWREMAGWVTSTPTLREWRQLSLDVARLLVSNPPDPATALSEYLQRGQFDLPLRSFRVVIPDDLRDRLKPDGKLSVFHTPIGDTVARRYTFRQEGEGVKETSGSATAWTLVADGPTTVAYKPGDGFWVEMPLKDAAGRAWVLTWLTSRSQVYQYARVLYTPRLKTGAEPLGAGEVVAKVALQVTEPVPPEPDLLPYVRFDRR